jgi:hypothetical protein
MAPRIALVALSIALVSPSSVRLSQRQAIKPADVAFPKRPTPRRDKD